jgi:hypothetical protein
MHVIEKAMRLGGNKKARDLESIRYPVSAAMADISSQGILEGLFRNLINGNARMTL